LEFFLAEGYYVRMPTTFRINNEQRKFFGNHVTTFLEGSRAILEQICKDEPQIEVIEQALGSIQHDLNTLRHAVAMERGKAVVSNLSNSHDS
jgi:hypothetical protein